MITPNEWPLQMDHRLILGTAQFGMAYGATNDRGQVTAIEASHIIAKASASGVRLIDTAAGYGISEQLLGRSLRDFPEMDVITKSIGVETKEVTRNDVDAFRASFGRSLERLHRSSVDGYLFHSAEDLLKPGSERLIEYVSTLKNAGIARRIGISVYSAAILDRVLKVFRPDIVQIPVNIFDQRLVHDRYLDTLRNVGIEIHARSVFLQGLLLVEPRSLNSYFSRFGGVFNRYGQFIESNSLTRMTACLGFVLMQAGAHSVVVGVTSAAELGEVLEALHTIPELLPDMTSLQSGDEALIDPRMWPARS